MALVINTNVASINAQRNLAQTQSVLDTSLARLSSGMRITAAKDDSAGLAISEKLRAQIRGLAQAERNANDGISLVQTADGALNEVSNILIRMRELAVQASTGTLGTDERGYADSEYDQLVSEIDRIANVIEFNGTKLLDGSMSAGAMNFQVGIQNTANDRISVAVSSTKSTDIGSSGTKISATGVDTAVKAQSALTVIDDAIKNVSSRRGDLGSAQNRLSITVNNLASMRENLSAANSRIRDVDVAAETVEMTRSQILMQAGVAVLAQANQLPAMALTLLG